MNQTVQAGFVLLQGSADSSELVDVLVVMSLLLLMQLLGRTVEDLLHLLALALGGGTFLQLLWIVVRHADIDRGIVLKTLLALSFCFTHPLVSLDGVSDLTDDARD